MVSQQQHYNSIVGVSDLTVFVCRAARELKNEANAHILNHKNVVTLHASIFEPEHYGIVLEFVPNGCLEDYIDQNKVLFNRQSAILLVLKIRGGNWYI